MLPGKTSERSLDVTFGVMTSTRGAVVSAAEESTKGEVMVHEPAVEAALVSSDGTPLPLGREVSVRLTEADPARRRVRFELP